jgi:hypothetical protein
MLWANFGFKLSRVALGRGKVLQICICVVMLYTSGLFEHQQEIGTLIAAEVWKIVFLSIENFRPNSISD